MGVCVGYKLLTNFLLEFPPVALRFVLPSISPLGMFTAIAIKKGF